MSTLINPASGLPPMRLPLWQDLPTFDLHLTQLLDLTNQYLAPITHDTITKTMMHNYFKANVLVPPDKKHYHQIHLAGAIVVGLLKNIFTLEELRLALQYILVENSPQTGYDRFANMFNHEAADGTFKRSKLSDEQLSSMSVAAVIQYNAMEALLFWLAARQLLQQTLPQSELDAD
ncbi:DUF1836 domain-containing protein [Furfurilactobacillus curtus]|uniref:DUF1836 domain-containing protein n=1 Tax=Furfurilactobacillus curtus TaxID=1746200 RepID=A0ABQ5JQ11_9LACO